eukprot:CAMPEP_0117893126 /NCGR_PEP_ID=MMETSP0950-20121206/25123_1 /TAXON_ID=44440 /ORGANISM="Chattonella subsalsa, Strain CCMP2191" /LENGTH=924 /DNA_ID=CAMNT_0005753291 /DNA_START=99 /DNA_END=2875 /DNA_ORIENTATION=+
MSSKLPLNQQKGNVSTLTELRGMVKEDFLPWFVFTESGYIRLGYDWVVCLTGYMIVLCVPLQCVYGMELGSLHGVMLVLDLLMMMDMVLTANLAFRPQQTAKLQPLGSMMGSRRTLMQQSSGTSGYRESTNMLLEGRRRKIVWHYLTGSFFWDAISLVPMFAMDLRALARFKDSFSLQVQVIALLKLAWFTLFLVFAHYMGMAFLFLGKVQSTDVTWITTQETQGVWQEYLESMYWALSSALTVGYGDVTPITYKEKTFTCIMFLVSTMIHASIMGAVTVLLGQMSNRNHAFLEKLQNAYHFFKRYKKEIPKEMRHRVIRYMDYNWQHQNILDINPIMGELPDHLEREIKIAIMQDVVLECDLFKDVDQNFVAEVIMAMEQVNLLAGDCIFREGDLGTTMYFVLRGSLEAKTGNYFGEVSILRAPQRRSATIKALSNCQLLTLARDPLKRILNMWPKMYRQLEKAANERMLQNRKRNVSKVAKMFGSKIKSGDTSLKMNVTYDIVQEMQKSDFALEIEQNISKRAQKRLKVLEIKLKAVSQLQSPLPKDPAEPASHRKPFRRSKSEVLLHEDPFHINSFSPSPESQENQRPSEDQAKSKVQVDLEKRRATAIPGTSVCPSINNSLASHHNIATTRKTLDLDGLISLESITSQGGHCRTPGGSPKPTVAKPALFTQQLRLPEKCTVRVAEGGMSHHSQESLDNPQREWEGLLSGELKSESMFVPGAGGGGGAANLSRLGSLRLQKVKLPRMPSKRKGRTLKNYQGNEEGNEDIDLDKSDKPQGISQSHHTEPAEPSFLDYSIRSCKSMPTCSNSNALVADTDRRNDNSVSPLKGNPSPSTEKASQGAPLGTPRRAPTGGSMWDSLKGYVNNMDVNRASTADTDSSDDDSADNAYSMSALRNLPMQELCSMLSKVSQVMSEQTMAT